MSEEAPHLALTAAKQRAILPNLRHALDARKQNTATDIANLRIGRSTKRPAMTKRCSGNLQKEKTAHYASLCYLSEERL
jgi:hypothetical protein